MQQATVPRQLTQQEQAAIPTPRPAALPIVALGIALVILPIFVRPVVAAEICIYGIAAVALNLIFGYTGMLSFGQAAFFGLGAYASGLTLIHVAPNLFLGVLVGTGVGTLAAIGVGFLAIRRQGVYFVMLTLCLNQLFFFVAYKWTAVTGGDDGLGGIPRPPIDLLLVEYTPDTSLKLYALMAVVLMGCMVIMTRIVDSPFGLICQTIRENPVRAAAIGLNVFRYRWAAFAIAGAFTAFAGSFFGLLYGIVPNISINWLTSGNIVLMVLVGGIGKLYGPLFGALFFTWLSETFSLIWERWPLLLGLVLIFVVLYLRGGFVALLEQGQILWQRQQQPRQQEIES